MYTLLIFKNRNFIFGLGFFLGLVLGEGTRWSRELVLPALAVVMTVSTLGISGDFFRNYQKLILPALTGIFMTFLIQGGLLLGIGRLLTKDEMLWTGIVLLASVPPAIATIPFTILLDGDSDFSLAATMGGYLVGLLFTPLICIAFLGSTFIHPIKILIILSELVVAPVIASRVLILFKIDKYISPVKGAITNWGFFVVIYTVIGLNRDLFFNDFRLIIPIIFLTFLATFGLGTLIEFSSRYLKISPQRIISIKLLGTLKNSGTAAGIALVLFGKKASIPAAIFTTMMIVYFLFLDISKNWKRKEAF